MANSKVLTGPRCIVYLGSDKMGIFTNVTWGVNINAQDIHTIGNTLASEITKIDYDTVTVSLSGFRVDDKGPFSDLNMPKVAQIFEANPQLTLQIVDKTIATAPGTATAVNLFELHDAVVLNYNCNLSARGILGLEMTVRGIRFRDQGDDNVQGDTNNVPL